MRAICASASAFVASALLVLGGCSGTGDASSSSGGYPGQPPCGGALATSTGAVPIASGQVQPLALAVDATSAYWTSPEGRVMKVPIAGGEPATLARSPRPDAIAVDATSVYWSDSGCISTPGECFILKVPLSGGTLTTLEASQSYVGGFAVTASHVYWVDGPSGPVSRVMARPLAGGVPVTLATFTGVPRAIAVDAASVYWTSLESVAAVSSVPLTGGAPVTITTPADNTSDLGGLAVDATHVYWTATVRTQEQQGIATNALMMVPKGGGVATTLASQQQNNTATSLNIVVDASGVYWPPQDEIIRVPAGGGQVVTLAQGQCAANAIAVDATSTYWTDENAGTVMRLRHK